MRPGEAFWGRRDDIAATVDTLAFAYPGASLPVLSSAYGHAHRVSATLPARW